MLIQLSVGLAAHHPCTADTRCSLPLYINTRHIPSPPHLPHFADFYSDRGTLFVQHSNNLESRFRISVRRSSVRRNPAGTYSKSKVTRLTFEHFG